MRDRYVIVYRDGYMGFHQVKRDSDFILANAEEVVGRTPAYRIRIRVKPDIFPICDRLDPAMAYAAAGIRR